MEHLSEQTLAGIVMQNHLAVPVLEKYNLDFCCKGKRSLSQACMEKGLEIATLLEELQAVCNNEKKARLVLEEMSAEQLISYILINHHFYVKQSMPTIQAHLEKVATKHGERFPYMVKVALLFNGLKEEMGHHMQKEEMILFPRIKETEAIFLSEKKTGLQQIYIGGPIRVMETEHDEAGEIMYQIRELTNNYTAPADACTTFRISLGELKEFEEDLHRHVHLENNLLFPKAKKMMLEISIN